MLRNNFFFYFTQVETIIREQSKCKVTMNTFIFIKKKKTNGINHLKQ